MCLPCPPQWAHSRTHAHRREVFFFFIFRVSIEIPEGTLSSLWKVLEDIFSYNLYELAETTFQVCYLLFTSQNSEGRTIPPPTPLLKRKEKRGRKTNRPKSNIYQPSWCTDITSIWYVGIGLGLLEILKLHQKTKQ